MGLSFRPSEAKAAYRNLEEGDTVWLDKEPDNKYDPNAVKVLVEIADDDYIHIGYVAKGEAAVLSPRLSDDELVEATVTTLLPPNSAIFDVEV